MANPLQLPVIRGDDISRAATARLHIINLHGNVLRGIALETSVFALCLYQNLGFPSVPAVKVCVAGGHTGFRHYTASAVFFGGGYLTGGLCGRGARAG